MAGTAHGLTHDDRPGGIGSPSAPAQGAPPPPIRGLFSVLLAVPALALLVATLNDASPAIKATVLAYLVVSGFAILPYVAWRRRAGKGASQTN